MKYIWSWKYIFGENSFLLDKVKNSLVSLPIKRNHLVTNLNIEFLPVQPHIRHLAPHKTIILYS